MEVTDPSQQQQQHPVLHQEVGSIPETAVLTVESMQAAISTAAALAAAGAVSSPPNQTMHTAASLAPSGSMQPHIASAPALGATPTTPYSSTRSVVAPMVPPQQTSSATQKSLYAGYTISQQRVPPVLAPLLFPTSTAHVIPHNQQPTTTATNTKSAQQASIFDQMKLRRGKWTAEEEAYADLLIAEFEKGTVEGCQNGCTLRSFLSKKLHCAPMRISKKYAGKSIGKHVFLSRSTVNGIGKPDTGGPDNKAKLQELEIKFYKSLFRETETNMMVPPYMHHFNSGMHAGHQMMSPSVNPYTPAVAPSFIPYSSQGQTAQAPMPWPTMPAGPVNEQDQRAQLHQTFMNVLNQTPLGPAPHSTSQATQMRAALVAPAPLVAPHMPAAPKPVSPNPMAGAPAAPRFSMPALSEVQRAPSQPVMQQTVQQAQGARTEHPSQVPMHVQIPTQPGGSHYQEMSAETMDLLPDFLSGFDKIAAKSVPQPTFHAGPVSNGRQSSQYSPPFTSRSFDDFHQLLGKGLSPRPLDLNNSYRGFPQPPFDSTSQHPTHPADPEARQSQVSADSYALFAQQSVLAVSQHSAYCSEGNPPSIQLPTLNANANIQRGLPSTMFTPSVVNAANLQAHSEAQSAAKSALVSGSEKSDWGASTEESGSIGVISRGSGSESNTGSDNASDNSSNDSDSMSVEGPQKEMKVRHHGQQQRGPQKKKMKFEHHGQQQRAQLFRPTEDQ